MELSGRTLPIFVIKPKDLDISGISEINKENVFSFTENTPDELEQSRLKQRIAGIDEERKKQLEQIRLAEPPKKLKISDSLKKLLGFNIPTKFSYETLFPFLKIKKIGWLPKQKTLVVNELQTGEAVKKQAKTKSPGYIYLFGDNSHSIQDLIKTEKKELNLSEIVLLLARTQQEARLHRNPIRYSEKLVILCPKTLEEFEQTYLQTKQSTKDFDITPTILVIKPAGLEIHKTFDLPSDNIFSLSEKNNLEASEKERLAKKMAGIDDPIQERTRTQKDVETIVSPSKQSHFH